MNANNYFQCFELLTNTWMTVGCYDVQMVVHEQGKEDRFEQVKFAHFSDCEAYKFKFQSMYLNHIEMYDETKVLQYVIVVEESWDGVFRLCLPGNLCSNMSRNTCSKLSRSTQ